MVMPECPVERGASSDDEVDLRRIDERLRILERIRQSECKGDLLRAGKAGVRDADHIILVRQGLKCRNMGRSGPVKAGICDLEKFDRPETKPLVFRGPRDRSFSQRCPGSIT